VKPRALDLFCCAGGAGMGLHRAGFEVVGVDIQAQQNYPFEFHQADALEYPLAGFDFIWASPPCQDYSALKGLAGERRPRLIRQVRSRFVAAGVPWAIENVVGSELHGPITLCGSMFGLGVWRHRQFEMSCPPLFTPQCQHALCPKPVDVTGTGGEFTGIRKKIGGGVSRKPRNLAHAREVMGIDWMNRRELSQAIPPAFAEFVGQEAMKQIILRRAAA
jgi:DNA (cytosine-5)-methyltransferase 1